MSRTSADPIAAELARWRVPGLLLVLTFLSTFLVGATNEVQPEVESYTDLLLYFATHPLDLARGWTFAIPLMSILLAHEMGHYVAGKIHRVDVSPPYFIPLPLMLGTMGAVIRMRDAIERRNALLDIGAAGPLAGMVVAVPVLFYGLSTSDVISVADMPEGSFVEGRNLLYLALLYVTKGPIDAQHDILLNNTAFAGWAGLLVTQINLVPVMQLDGGHVAYALLGEKQNTYSSRVHLALPFVGAAVSLLYMAPAYAAGERGDALVGEALAGIHWVIWFVVLSVMMRFAGKEHPPTRPEPLSPGRKVVAVATLVLFVLLFMPSWIYVPHA